MMKEVKKERLFTATVLSNKMDKTAVVLLERKVKHQKYKKYVTKSSKYKIHDENNVCNIGDVVSIKESKPISKDKSWKLVEVLSKREQI